jgi:RNA-directed DNA polymerase
MPNGIGQLLFTFGEPRNDAEETEATSAGASSQPETVSSETSRKEERAPRGKRKWHSLIDKVYALRNLEAAWERVQANDGAPGSDGITVGQYAAHAGEWLPELAADLRAKTYRPQPVRRVYIPKSGGGKRPLGIPTIRDRIVQQALLQVLGPIFEAKFSRRSHGFRPEKGCVTALTVVDRAVRAGYEWVVDADLQSFFDTVDHGRLLKALNEEVADGTVLRLIGRILTAGVLLPETSAVEPTELGTPQGGPLSPLLANVYLHAFDLAMEAAGIGLVRYADDFVLFAKSESEAAAALTLARQVLEGEWGLRLHPEKTCVVSIDQGFEFLGFHYFRDPARGTLRKEVRRKSAQRFRETVRTRTPRLRGQRKPKARHLTRTRLARNQRLTEMIKGLNRFLGGWHWYFKAVWSAYPETPFRNFDSFVRRRLRSAITGRRGTGWWHQRLSNALFRDLGLLSLDEQQRNYRAWSQAATARKGTIGGEPYAGKPHVRFGKTGGLVTSP